MVGCRNKTLKQMPHKGALLQRRAPRSLARLGGYASEIE